MITQSTRQGILLIFCLLVVWVGVGILEMTYFEAIFLASMGAVITKLTDIQEEIRGGV